MCHSTRCLRHWLTLFYCELHKFKLGGNGEGEGGFHRAWVLRPAEDLLHQDPTPPITQCIILCLSQHRKTWWQRRESSTPFTSPRECAFHQVVLGHLFLMNIREVNFSCCKNRVKQLCELLYRFHNGWLKLGKRNNNIINIRTFLY